MSSNRGKDGLTESLVLIERFQDDRPGCPGTLGSVRRALEALQGFFCLFVERIRVWLVVGMDDHSPVRLGFTDRLLVGMRPGLPLDLQFAHIMERNSEQHGPLQLVGSQVKAGALGQPLRREGDLESKRRAVLINRKHVPDMLGVVFQRVASLEPASRAFNWFLCELRYVHRLSPWTQSKPFLRVVRDKTGMDDKDG